MRLTPFLTAITSLLMVAATAAFSAPLNSQIEQSISTGGAARALWGIHAIELETGRVLADVNGSRLLVPASNRKLVTTAMAVSKFKPDERIETTLYATDLGADGVVRGALVVKAVGDPSWSPEFTGGRPGQARLEELAKAAQHAGITRVLGDLVIDVGRFEDPEPIPPAWAWDELQASYAPRPAALSMNQNLVGIRIEPGTPGDPLRVSFATSADPFEIINNSRTLGGGSAPTLRLERDMSGKYVKVEGGLPAGDKGGSRSIPSGNPVMTAARAFKEELEEVGVRVDGIIRLERNVDGADTKVASILGAPISDVVRICNKESDNFLAESLYLLCAADHYGRASYHGGHELERTFWKRMGVEPGEVRPSDGSGLSRENGITPHALVELLASYREVPWFIDSLPVSGKSGTLRYRLSGKYMAGRVQAKTGTLDGVSALSGYVRSDSGRTVVFSIMANNYTSSTASIRRKIDDIVETLAAQ